MTHSKKEERLQDRQGFSKWDYLLALAICIPCAILCVLLSQNEVYMDDWYIEGSADGFFGADNRSIWVLGANWILTGSIYLLSLTGIRLFWLHVILVFVNFVSHVLITLVMFRNLGRSYGTVFSILFGLIMGPLTAFEFQFTTTAAYGIAAGCVFMLDAVKHRQKGAVWFSAVWIVFSSGVRFDGIYYSLAYMGVFWLFQNLPDVFHCRKEKKWDVVRLQSILKERLLPFVITIAICLGVEFSYRIALDYAVPGFREFNSVRTQIDDCEMPDYETYRAEYEKIGLSQNDYNLMCAWNNMDPEFFTQEKLEQILDVAKLAESQQAEDEEPAIPFWRDIWNSASQRPAMWITSILFALAFLLSGGTMMWCCLAVVGVTCVFYVYFLSIGRLIWRTEWPIWILINCMNVLIICESCWVLPEKRTAKHRIMSAALAVVLFFCPFYNAHSLRMNYKVQSVNWRTVGFYLQARFVWNEEICYETYCQDMTNAIVADKDNYYFALGSPGYWLQMYPMPAVDTFCFGDVGDGENWGTLGQYFAILPQVTNAYHKYGIDNPFRDLVHDNVRVTCRGEESYWRIQEVYGYLLEHYYDHVSFSMLKPLHNNEAVVGRFMSGNPAEDAIQLKGKIKISYDRTMEEAGVVQLDLDTSYIPNYDPGVDEAYVCLTGDDGCERFFSVYELNPEKIVTYAFSLDSSQRYVADFIFCHDSMWYAVEKAGILNPHGA